MSAIRAARFLEGYLRGGPVAYEPVTFGSVEATLYHPPARRSAPAWIVLHGITVPGREHPALVRFARALARSGAWVLVPDIPAWRELRIAPGAAQRTIAASTEYLTGRPDVRGTGLGLLGFSFGATQAVIAAGDPVVRDTVRAVAGFGGYCDLRRTLVAMMTGEHEWSGVNYRLNPDPYGRWIVAANYLTRIPEYSGMHRVAEGLRQLAAEAGLNRRFAGDPSLDASKARLRASLEPEEQRIWDLLAHGSGAAAVEREAAEEFAERLAAAGVDTEPLLDPRPVLREVRSRVVLAHGRSDQLIPFTETLRLAAALPPQADPSATITGLFAHAGGSGVRVAAYAREGFRFAKLLRAALGSV